MDKNCDVSFEPSDNEVSFDEINKSLSVICLDDIENEQAHDTESTSGLQFCSSTPIRTTRKHRYCNTDGANNLGEPPFVDLCTSNKNSQAVISLAHDDDLISIDTSMSTLSLVGNEENRLDCQDSSLLIDPVPTCRAFLKGKGEGDVQCVSTKNVCAKPIDDLHMSVVITEQSKILGNACITTTDSKTKKSLSAEDKRETKKKQHMLKSLLPNEIKNEFISATTAISIPKKLLEFSTYQPSDKRETQTSKEKKHSHRKKFLRDKQKKKLAASRANKNEEKENKQEPVTSQLKEHINLTKLITQKQECQNIDEKSTRCVFQVIQDWIGEAPPEKKDGEKKIQEFVSDDQKENLDINDPEWDNVKCLKTDEERYKAVKDCWKSQRAPNPQKDLTFHSYRHKRVKAYGRKLLRNKKRTATSNIDCALVTKLRKVEEAPCTLFLDRKITDAKKQFTSQKSEHLLSFSQAKQKLDKDYAKRNEDIAIKYHSEVNRIKNMRAVFSTERWLLRSLNNWQNTQKQWLHEELLKEKKKVEKKEHNVLNNLNNNYSFTLKKLGEARNEVLKFNQFYCGFNKLDPTILRGQFLEEIISLEDMYLTYEKHYGLAH